MKRITVLYILLLAIVNLLSGQKIDLQLPQINPLSPSASSIIKYLDYGVSHSTGIPNITIPIYEIHSGDMVLPINLTYHASGLKPKEISGWIGSGWTLHAAPIVTRVINGIADDYLGTQAVGYFNNTARSNLKMTNRDQYFKRRYNGEFDEEPDRFMYSLAFQQGSFYYSDKYQNGVAAFIPSPIDAVMIMNNPTTPLDAIIMKDSQGIQYNFGGSDNYRAVNDLKETVDWYCNEMTSPLDQNSKITFEYENVSPPLISFNLNDYIVIEDDWPEANRSDIGFVLTEKINNTTTRYFLKNDSTLEYMGIPSHEYSVPNRYRTGITKVRRLSKIKFNNGSLEFIINSKSDLSEIQLKDLDGTIISRFKFSVTKYNETKSDFSIATKLDFMEIYSRDNEKIQTYKFNYRASNDVADYLTKNVDHWGYYNGNYKQKTTVPGGYLDYILKATNRNLQLSIGGNRESDEESMKIGILESIENSLGNFTSFMYEANRYGGFDTDTNEKKELICGGLRIKLIKVHDTFSQKSYSRFFGYGYNNGTLSSPQIFEGLGVPFLKGIGIDEYCHTQNKKYIDGASGNVQKVGRLRTWSSNAVADITYSNGSSVLYNYVTEQKVSSEGKSQLTKYYFYTPTIPNLNMSHKIPSGPFGIYRGFSMKRASTLAPFDAKEPFASDYGMLLQKEYLSNSKLVEREEFFPYFMLNRDQHYLWPVANNLDFNRQYRIITNKMYKSTVVEVVGLKYNEQQHISKNEEYSDLNMSIEAHFTPIGRTIKTEYQDNGIVRTIKDFDFSKHGIHMQPIKISTKSNFEDNGSNSKQGDYEEYYQYEELSGSFNSRVLNPEEYHLVVKGDSSSIFYNNHNGTMYPDIMKKKQNVDELQKIRTYHNHTLGKVASYSEGENPSICILWSYNNEYPVMMIENISYADLISELGESWIKELALKAHPTDSDLNTLNNLRKSLKQSLVTTYTYKPLVGMLTATDPRGVTTYYEYDGFGRLKETYLKDATGNKNTLQMYDYNYGNQ